MATKKLANPLDQALNFLSFRPRSASEVSRYLDRKNWGQKTVVETIDKLKELKFLDDAQFVRWWQESRDSSRPRGARLLRLELFHKGIPKDIIESEVNNSPDTELTRARAVLTKKFRHGINLKDQKTKDKAIRLLASRGFSWDIIKQTFLGID